MRRRYDYYDDDDDNYYYDRYGYYEPSRPIKVQGGIKAQSKRGKFGQSWWAKRWISVLESFNIGARLTRGRSYARGGQVLSIDVGVGKVTASVQGSQVKPYQVHIEVPALSDAEWCKVAQKLAAEAIFSAKLLAGEMPQNIEKVFAEVKLSLFPLRHKDLKTRCSCPDSSNPCKHIAAVYYLLGEEFDRDPFLLFKLRGMTREKFLELMGNPSPEAHPQERKGKSTRKTTGVQPTVVIHENEPKTAAVHENQSALPEPVPAEPKLFWQSKDLPANFLGEPPTPPLPAALPKSLGGFPFWRGEENFLNFLEKVYKETVRTGMEIVEKV